MRLVRRVLPLAGAALLLHAELIDRIAVTVGDRVITESEIVLNLRLRAMLAREPLVIDGKEKRAAAERLVEQALLLKEIQVSRFPEPTYVEARDALEQNRPRLFLTPAEFEKALREYHVTEEDVIRHLQRQIAISRFVDFRFSSGSEPSDEEVRAYYEKNFAARLKDRGQSVPPLDEVRGRIENILQRQKANANLDEWLRQSKNQTRIRYREEVFQ